MRIIFSIAAIIFFACCNNSEAKDETLYKQQKESLEEKEKKNPLTFLKIAGDDKRNLIGQTVVKGKIINTATVCIYKNVRIKMLCYKNNRLAEEHEDVIEENIEPGASKKFKTRYRLPKGTDSIAVSIMSAAVAEAVKK